ncbi:hypothetical protein FRB96_001602 [Tulasnella sp. 330]|nr:hypothetical protein FRB96_001602 [Tulasnella sp. 330]
MLRTRLPTPLLKELHAKSVDSVEGRDIISAFTNTFDTSTFSESEEDSHLIGRNSLLDDQAVTGSDTLGVLHLAPNDQGINLSPTGLSTSTEGSLIGGSGSSPLSDLSPRLWLSSTENSELLNLRPRRRLLLHRTATAIAHRRLLQERDSDPLPLTEVYEVLDNDAEIREVKEMTHFDAIQSTDSVPNLMNNLSGRSLGARLQKRQLDSISLSPSSEGGPSFSGIDSHSVSEATASSDPYQSFSQPDSNDSPLSSEGLGLAGL